MEIGDVVAHLEDLGGVLLLTPQPGDGSPEIAWGDTFAYWSPDGTVPPGQPFATIVTKDYPDDTTSGLDRPGAFRVNVAAGTEGFTAAVGYPPPGTAVPEPRDDVVLPHPVYARLGWLAVTNPGPRSSAALRELLTSAHGLARARAERRAEHDG